MRRSIRLLGKPSIEADGYVAARPRGHKAWAVLAYLLLCPEPPPRQRLAALLFSDADDPLAALRWNLAQLRRGLGDPDALQGDPPLVGLGPDDVVDVDSLSGEVAARAVDVDRVGRQLLEGMAFPSSPAFEAWLTVERQRLVAAGEALLREAALAALAADRVDDALPLAGRLVELNPLDDSSQELLVRCLARTGDRRAALTQVAACEDLFYRELGVAPSPSVRRAARPPLPSVTATAASAALAGAQLEAGRAAVQAGAVDDGLAALRRALAQARACGEPEMHARALLALGSALLHTMRGSNEEAAAFLHEAIAAARPAGQRGVLVEAQRQLAFIDARAGRYPRADRWLRDAEALVERDDEVAGVLLVRGMVASDTARYPEALRVLREAADRARRAEDDRLAAFALSLLARAHLLRGELHQAAIAVDESLASARRLQWLSFLPWPEALRADIDLQTGDHGAAARTAEHAFALACHVEDPCWEGLSARVLARLDAVQGRQDHAWERLTDARARVTRTVDPYHWASGQVLDTLCELAVTRWPQRAGEPLDALTALAARHGLRELTVRAHLHRSLLNQTDHRPTARLLASEIDNPALETLLAESGPHQMAAARGRSRRARRIVPSGAAGGQHGA